MNVTNLQTVVQSMADTCGFADEAPQALLVMLTEETGELARAVRHQEGIRCAPDTTGAEISEELADCAILLLRIAAAYHVNLSLAVIAKAAKNERRYSSALGA